MELGGIDPQIHFNTVNRVVDQYLLGLKSRYRSSQQVISSLFENEKQSFSQSVRSFGLEELGADEVKFYSEFHTGEIEDLNLLLVEKDLNTHKELLEKLKPEIETVEKFKLQVLFDMKNISELKAGSLDAGKLSPELKAQIQRNIYEYKNFASTFTSTSPMHSAANLMANAWARLLKATGQK